MVSYIENGGTEGGASFSIEANCTKFGVENFGSINGKNTPKTELVIWIR